MAHYRTKPTTVQAWQLPSPRDPGEAPDPWVIEALLDGRIRPQQSGGAYVASCEGELFATVGDWIVRDIYGTFVVRSNQAFSQAYEPVESTT